MELCRLKRLCSKKKKVAGEDFSPTVQRHGPELGCGGNGGMTFCVPFVLIFNLGT